MDESIDRSQSLIIYVITDAQLLRESGVVNIDSTDIGMYDHFLVWLELLGNSSVQLDGGVLIGLVMMLLQKSTIVKQRLRHGERGHEGKVLKEWESIVNRVARDTVGEKVIVCGISVRWWDDEIEEKIEQRRQLIRGWLGVRKVYGMSITNCVVRLSI